MDNCVIELGTSMHLPLSMIQLKNAVTDLTGLVLVIVYQPQKTVQRDNYRLTVCYRQISSLQTAQVVSA